MISMHYMIVLWGFHLSLPFRVQRECPTASIFCASTVHPKVGGQWPLGVSEWIHEDTVLHTLDTDAAVGLYQAQ